MLSGHFSHFFFIYFFNNKTEKSSHSIEMMILASLSNFSIFLTSSDINGCYTRAVRKEI